MRVAKIRRLHARRTAGNLPMSSRDHDVASESSAADRSRNSVDGGDPPDSPPRLESELRQVPLFLRRRRL